jgi:hypothetical protein
MQKSGYLTVESLRHAVTVMAIGAVYWALVAQAEGISEPWDAAWYWTAYYPLSLLTSAMAGVVFGRRHGVTGFSLIIPQAYVMLFTMDDLARWPIGLGFCVALSIPAVLAAWLAARLVRR